VTQKRLLISVPSSPNGFYSAELSWFLTAVNVQSTLNDFADVLAGASNDLAARIAYRRLADKAGVGWNLEFATLQWQDVRKIRDIGKTLVPHGWSVVTSPVYGAPISAVRNEQARRFLFSMNHETGKLEPTDFDATLFIDTDNVPGRHDLHVLCEDIMRDDVDVVGGVYCMESPEGPRPLVYKLTETGEGFEYDTETIVKPIGVHLLEKGGLPGGMLMVKRRVFEKLWEARRTWFKDRLHDCSFEYHEIADLVARYKDDRAGLYDALKSEANKKGTDWTLGTIGSWNIGEDIWFCRMCHDLGIPIHIDTRVFAKHLKVADNKQTFLAKQAIGKRWFGMGVESERGAPLSDDEKAEAYRKFAVGKAKAAKAAMKAAK
jgi:hypothetical protein